MQDYPTFVTHLECGLTSEVTRPLIPLDRPATRPGGLWVKEEGCLPIGSFKARGLGVAEGREKVGAGSIFDTQSALSHRKQENDGASCRAARLASARCHLLPDRWRYGTDRHVEGLCRT